MKRFLPDDVLRRLCIALAEREISQRLTLKLIVKLLGFLDFVRHLASLFIPQLADSEQDLISLFCLQWHPDVLRQLELEQIRVDGGRQEIGRAHV